MPASSSPSDGRKKWRRTRGPKSTKRHRVEDDEDDEEEDDDYIENDNDNEEADEDEDLHPNPNPKPNPNNNSNPQIREVVPGSGIRISTFPPAVKYTVIKHQYQQQLNVAVLENISHGQLQVVSAVPADSPGLVGPDQDTSFVITPPPLLEGKGILKTLWNRPLLLPHHSDWFHPTTVHRLERQAVPHFFSPKSPHHSPDKYLASRNSILAKYMDSPLVTLSLEDCLQLPLPLDNHDVSRIYRFLDHWGIINFSASSPPARSSTLDSYLREEPTGEVHVPSPSLKSMDCLITFDKPKSMLNPPQLHSSNYDHLADLDSRIRERLSENHCNYCSRPLLLVFYQSIKEADTLVCPDCYHESRLVVGHSSTDFVKVDSVSDYGDQDGDRWTDQETLLLLEALEVYNDNWNDIADHVGTKSKSQCILHFLRLPMEDGLLENIEVPSCSTQANGSKPIDNGRMSVNANGPSVQDSDSDNKFPFATSENPVMALVAFLASAVGPRIAAACAHACLAALSEDEGSLNTNRGDDSDDRPLETRNYGQQKEENLGAQGSRVPNNVNQEASPLPSEKVNSAAKVGLAAAAIKAKLFADHEEREIQRLSAIIVNHQLKRLELKLKQFAEVETLLMKECEQVEKTRQTLAGERARALGGRFGPSGVASPMNVPPQVVNNNMNSRPPVMSSSPSQPNVSGYGGSQISHPHMPFLARQQMFSYGPRLPLSAIHPSSSGSSSSIMFGTQGSSQSSLNHPILRPVPGTSSGTG